jgi:transposase-like protein
VRQSELRHFAEKGLQVGKKRVGRYPQEFRELAVERMKSCDNIAALAQELGVHRTALYQWRDQLGPREQVPQSRLERENQILKQVLADKTLEADFFEGALQKVEARRQGNGSTGETASTTKSGS